MNKKHLKKIINEKKELAKKGDVNSCLELGNLYILNDDYRNVHDGIKYLKRASDKKCKEAYHVLGYLYDEGEYVERNQCLAVEYYTKAAALGCPYSMVNLGYMYEYGDGVDVDLNKAVDYYEKSAALNNLQGIYNLAHTLIDNHKYGIDVPRAIELFEKGIKLGSTKCMQAMAIIYSEGVHIEENPELAFKLFEQSATMGQKSSYESYAVCLLEGYGTEKNVKEGLIWSRKSIDAGSYPSMSNMGLRYIRGEGVHVDRKLGIEYLTKAINAGCHPHSIECLFEVINYHEFADYDDDNLHKHAKLLADNGSPVGRAILAYTYRVGKGTLVDHDIYESIIKSIDATKHKTTFLIKSLYLIENKYDLSINDYNYIFEKLFMLLDSCGYIKEKHILKETKESPCVAHFTSLDVIHKMFPIPVDEQGTNHFRLYNIEYMNDPFEGMVLFNIGEKSSELRSVFNSSETEGVPREVIWGGDSYSAYICSFTRHVDRLDLWRAYGKNGEGFAIVIPLSSFSPYTDESFKHYINYDATSDSGLPDSYIDTSKISHRPSLAGTVRLVKTTKSIQGLYKKELQKQETGALYKVIYDKAIAEETLDLLNEILINLRAYVKQIDDDIIYDIDAVLKILLSDLLFLYKNSEYASEEEARLVKMFKLGSEKTFLDESILPKVYAKTNSFIFCEAGSSIIIGPRVKDQSIVDLDLKYRLAKYEINNKVTIAKSNILYR